MQQSNESSGEKRRVSIPTPVRPSLEAEYMFRELQLLRREIAELKKRQVITEQRGGNIVNHF